MIIASLHEGKKFPVQLTIMRAGNGKFSTSKKKSYSLAKRQARNKRAHCPNFAGFNCCFRQIFVVFLGDSDSYYPVEHCTSANEYFRKLYMARQLGAKSFSNLASKLRAHAANLTEEVQIVLSNLSSILTGLQRYFKTGTKLQKDAI